MSPQGRIPNDKDILAMNTVDLLNYMGNDAQRWAQAFLVHTDLANAGPNFQQTVVGWFANALGFGETDGYNKSMDEIHHAAKNLGLDLTEVYTPGNAIEVAYGNGHPTFASARELQETLDGLNESGEEGQLALRDSHGIIWLTYGEERSSGGESCAWWLLTGDPIENMEDVALPSPDMGYEHVYQPIPLTEANYPVTLLYRPREVE